MKAKIVLRRFMTRPSARPDRELIEIEGICFVAGQTGARDVGDIRLTLPGTTFEDDLLDALKKGRNLSVEIGVAQDGSVSAAAGGKEEVESRD